jgi:ATP-dependent Clp protease protease subunit
MFARRLATSLTAAAGYRACSLSQAGPADVEEAGNRAEPVQAPAALPSPPSSEDELNASLLCRRRLFLLGDVTDDSANALIKRLLWLEAAAPGQPIELIINSSGGSLWAGFALLDTMRAISSPVHTCCLGRCRSLAAVLLAAGEPGHR